MTAPPREPHLARLYLTADEWEAVAARIDATAEDYPRDTEAGPAWKRWAWQLPERLTSFVSSFPSREGTGIIVVGGIPVDDHRIGPTPKYWRDSTPATVARREEILLFLLASLLGTPFSWSTLQDGRMINDICPAPGEEQAQSGSGSVNLEWHTEDGFHPYRCDYFGLMCLRNRQGVATTYADIRGVRLEPEVAAVLAEQRFIIRPDAEHLRNLPGGDGMAAQLRLWREPSPVSVLFGDPSQPYLRIDPHFMGVVPGDTVAAEALQKLVHAIDECLGDLVLTPGDIAFLDNYRVVHGRRAFTPSYRGDDRWLKKILVTRDIRKSRALRATESSVVLGHSRPVPAR